MGSAAFVTSGFDLINSQTPLSPSGIPGGEQHALQPSILEGDDTTSFWHNLEGGCSHLPLSFGRCQ